MPHRLSSDASEVATVLRYERRPMMFADLPLARRLEAADATMAAEFGRALARLRPERGAAVEAIAGGFAVYAGAGSPLSQAVGTGLAGSVSDSEIDRLEAFFRERGVPAQTVICPLADPPFVERLGRRGHRLAEFEDVLYRPLDRADEFAPPAAPIRISRAAPGELDAWMKVVLEGFFGAAPPPRAIVETFEAGFSLPANEFYLARMDGLLVGASGLSIREGIASLFGSSVLPPHRNRGVHAAMYAVRLERAVKAGCDVAAVGAKPGSVSHRNAERQGFRVAYTRAVLVRDIS
jgi:hypothetical protein